MSDMNRQISSANEAETAADSSEIAMAAQWVTDDPPEDSSAADQGINDTVDEPIMRWYYFQGDVIAQGFNLNAIGRGALAMSNIFLSASFVYLAREEAGCIDEEGEFIEECDGKAFGFQPASFVSNIAVMASVLTALFMPVIGAMVDYTPHRKRVGVVASALMILIQVIQIGTVSETWLPMALFQAIAAFLYEALILSTFAYLPEMSHRVDEATMTQFNSKFIMSQFASQVLFLLVITIISIAFSLKAVVTAQVSQAYDAVFSGVFFYFSWKLMEEVPARHVLKEGKSILTEGFVQVAKTVRDINRSYKKGTRWFFLAVTCAEAGANAFTVVAVVFLAEELGFSSLGIGIFFIVSLIFSIPGSFLGAYVTRKLDPKRSWRLVMVLLFLWSSIGAVVLKFLPENLSFLSFVWGSGIGLCLGWFYPVENLFFCMCLPQGQEAEFSGFYVYCSQILGWLPPLLFSIMVEAKVGQTFGVVAVGGFLLLAAGIVSCAAPWPEILEDCGRGDLPGTQLESIEDNLTKQDEKQQKEQAAPSEEGL